MRYYRLVAVICVAAACSNGDVVSDRTDGAPCVSHGLERLGESTLGLVACPVAPVLSGNVRLFVGLVNLDSRPRTVSARFEVFGPLAIEVTTPDGRVLDPLLTWEPQTFGAEFDPYLEWMLPRDGVLGRIINLSCVVEDVQHGPETGACEPLYDLPRGQQLRVVASLRSVVLCEETPCEERPQQVSLTAAPTTLVVRAR